MKTNVHFYIISMSSYPSFSPVIGLHFQLHQHVTLHLHKVAVLDKHKVSLTVKWLTRVASLHIIAPGRSVMLPEVAGYGPRISVPSPDEDTWENNIIKRPLQYVRWLKTLKLAGSILTHIHIPSPHCR